MLNYGLKIVERACWLGSEPLWCTTQDGRFIVSYLATVAGRYQLTSEVNGKVIADIQNIPAVVVPGPHDLKSFHVDGPVAGGVVFAGVAQYFTIEPRDTYGNFRPDDGRLICFSGSVSHPAVDPSLCSKSRLSLDMEMKTGSVLAGLGTANLAKVDLTFEPRDSSADARLPWRAGMYRGVFEARIVGQLVTTLTYGDDLLGPFTAKVASGEVDPSRVTLSGTGSFGAALGPAGSRSKTMQVFIEPRDVFGNIAQVPEGSGFEVTVVFADKDLGVIEGQVDVSEIVFVPERASYMFTYVARAVGQILVDITFDGVPISNGESVVLDVFEEAKRLDPAFTYAEGPGIAAAVVGERTFVNVVLMSISSDIDCVQDSLGNPLLPRVKRQRGCRGTPHAYSAGPDIVKARLDFQDIFDIVDHGNGTYSVYFRVQSSGSHALEISIGPDLENVDIGERSVPIGFSFGMYNLQGIPAATTQADVRFFDLQGEALPSGSLIQFYSGQPLKLEIQPKDEFGNLQDYLLAPEDEFRVDVIYEQFMVVEVDYLTRKSSSSLNGATFYYEAQVTMERSGLYLIDVSFRNSLTGESWESVATTTRVEVLPGIPDAFLSEITGEGIKLAAAGTENNFRLRLLDAAGNALGDGLDQKPLVEALLEKGSYWDETPLSTPTMVTPSPTMPFSTPDPGTTALPNPTQAPVPAAPTPAPTPTANTAPTSTSTATAASGSTPISAATTMQTPAGTPEAFSTIPTPTARRRSLLQKGTALGGVPPVVSASLLTQIGHIPIDISYDPEIEQYRGSYKVFTSGLYALDVRLYGRKLAIPGYVKTRVLAGEIFTPSCEVRGTGAGEAGGLPAGVTSDFTIIARDENGNALSHGGASWNVFLESATDIDPAQTTNWVPNGRHLIRATESEDGGITDLGDGTYRVRYKPLVAGTYLLNVMRGSDHALGSPMVVDVRAGATVANQSTLICSPDQQASCGLNDLQAGSQGVFYIQARDRFAGNKTTADDEFFYSVTGAGGYSKDSLATARGDRYPGQYRAAYNTEIAGPLKITATLRGSLVATITTVVYPGRVDAQRCTMSSAAFPVSSVWTPGSEPDLITITSRDAYGNRLSQGGLEFELLMSKTDESYAVTLTVEDNRDGTYQTKYINKEPGHYLVTGKLNLESIPFQSLTLVSGPAVIAHTEVSSASGAINTLPSFRAGRAGTFRLKFKDVWLNSNMDGDTIDLVSMQVVVSQGSTQEILVPGIDFVSQADLQACMASSTSTAQLDQCQARAGAFEITVTPRLSGMLRLYLSFQDDVLIDPETTLPFAAEVLPGPASPETTLVTGSALNGCLGGRPCWLQVSLADAHGNKLDKRGLLGVEQSLSLTYSLQGESGPTPVAMASIVQSTAELDNGNQRFEFTPPAFPSGEYLMRVTASLVAQVASSGAESGVIAEPVIVVYRGNDALDAGKSGVVDSSGVGLRPGSFLGNVVAGEKGTLLVQVRDRNGVDYMESVGSDFIAVDIQPDVADLIIAEDRPGLLEISFRGTRAGVYSAAVKIGSSRMVMGLYEMGVVPKWPSSPSESRLEIVSDGRRGNNVPSLTAEAGVALSVQVQLIDTYGNAQRYVPEDGPEAIVARLKKRLVADEEELPTVPCAVYDNRDGTYSASCTASLTGDYDLEVLLRPDGAPALVPLGQNRMNDPPVLVTIKHGEVFPPASSLEPSAAELTGVKLASGAPFEFSIVARDSFGNRHDSGGLGFEVGVQRLGRGRQPEVDTTVLPATNGTYLARLVASQAGTYRITVLETASGLVVDKAFEIVVEAGAVDLKKATVAGGGLQGGVAGEPLRFILRLYDAYSNPSGGQASLVSITAKPNAATEEQAGPWQSSLIGAVVNETAPGYMQISFALKSVGEHNVDILLGGVRVPGSPFKVVSSPRPPPALIRAAFDSSLSSILVTFDQRTDRGGEAFKAAQTARTGACGSVLAPAVVVKLGNAPVCDWVTDDSLRIFVGRGATILPTSLSAEGTQMQMLRNVVYNKARNSYAAANRVDIAVPLAIDETAKPVAVLSAPTVIGFCADLELDATPSFGGASRDLELAFSASATDRLSESISTALADAVRQSSVAGLVTVPAGAMDAGRVYTLRVAATNFLGLTDVASVTVRKSELPLPTVRIEGPAQRQVLRASGATVSVDVKMPDVTCLAVAARPAGAESRIVYNWTLVDGPDILESDFPSKSAYRLHVASLSTRYLYIPGNTLRSGVLADGSLFKYVFAVNVQMEGNSILSASANVGLSVLPEPISARIQGGDQVISPGSALALDVVAIDNENSPGPFSYTWLCQKDGEQSCFEADSSTLKVLVTAAERLELDEGTLSPGRYTFTVHVSREPLVPTRMVSSSVRITVSGGLSALSSGSIPDGGAVVVAQLPDSQDGSNAGGEGSGNGGSSGPGAEGPDPEAAWAISISAPAALEVPSSGRLLLQGVITPPPGASTVDVSLLWSCVEGDLSSPGALAAAAENSLQDSYLSLRPGSLTGGQLYRFRLEGGSMITGGVASEVAIRVAAAPWAGTLEVVSPQGVTASGRPRALELVSKLALMARDWNSGAVYDFSYVKNVEEILSAEGLEAASWRDFASLRVVTSQERYLGRAPEGSSTLAAILPEGTHMVVAYITSATGGQARVVFPHLFEVEQPPRLRRAMLQEDMVTQAQRSIDVALSPALAQGDLTSALQFVEIYASLYAGNAPAAPLGSCSLGSMELPTQLVTKTAIGIQGLLPSFRLRSTQDVCNMAELVQDPTQTSTAVVEEVLRALLEMLEGGDLLLRGLSCGADIISHAIANAESACGITQQGRNQLLLRSAQKAVSVLGKATVSTEGLRAGMQPIIFDTMQMAIEVSSHRQSRAAGEAISGKGGAGVAASASYDISFSEPGTPPLGPSTSAGVLEVHSTLTVFTWVNPLADQRQLERLASLPASITLRAVRINRATLGSGAATTVEDAALPAVTATQLTRAPAIKSTAGFSPILYVWRGADWAAPVGGNGTSFREGDAAWGSYFPGQLPLGLEADLPGTVTFAIWLRDPLPPRTPPPPPPTGDKPTAPAPTAAPPVVIEDAGNGVPSWFLWAIPVMAASALALAVGVFLIYRRRVQRNRLQELHPSEDQEDRDEKAEAKARGLDNGDGTPIGSPTQSERGALLADGGGWEIEQRHALSGAEQAERAAAREAEFRREADVESDAGTDIGLSDDEAEEHEAMQYIVADPFKNVPAKPLPRQHVSQATAVTGHFQAVPRPGSEAASAREPLFDNKRPTRLLQAERMRSGAVQPNQPRSRASLEPAEGGDAPPRWSTINGEHWTGRSQPQGPGRRPNDGKY